MPFPRRALLCLLPLLTPAATAADEPRSVELVEELVRAAEEGDLARVRAALAAGAEVDGLEPEEGVTALHRAVDMGHEEIVRALLAAGAGVDRSEPLNGATPLMFAVRAQETERGETTAPIEARWAVAETLLAAGARLDARNRWGGTALQWAADAGNLRMVERLIARGAGVDLGDDAGLTPLMVAANYEGEPYLAMVRALLAAKAKVDARDEAGATALMKAAMNHFAPDTVKALIAAGADLDAQTNEGFTALMLAARNGRTEIVRALVAAGADRELRTAAGETALGLAESAGFEPAAALLRSPPVE